MSEQPNPPEQEPTSSPKSLPPFDPSEVDPAVVSAKPERTNRKAVWSIVAGAFLVFPSVGLGVFAGVVAITSGIHARREIAASRGLEAGDNLAQIGIALGALGLMKAALLLYLNSR